VLKDFMKFVREQGVVGMAVGLAIGLAAADTVSKLVSGFIDPLVGWLLSFIGDAGDLSSRVWVVSGESSEHPLSIYWGDIISGVITLLAVAFVIFWVVKQSGLDKLDKKSN